MAPVNSGAGDEWPFQTLQPAAGEQTVTAAGWRHEMDELVSRGSLHK